ncbi:MAG: antibiotic biosynthesis monooxygenase [Bryobacterales bacterium]|nr:antibiotic biosynthesis monooxygenase [Bryobacterales bacterium]
MPTNGFVIVAAMRAKQDQVDTLREALLGLVAPTRAEAGCVQYDLHQDQREPAEFLFYEIWRNREVWLEHMETPHLQAFRAKADALLDGPLRLWEMAQVEP